MWDTIASIIVSVIAAFLYDVFKKMYFNRKNLQNQLPNLLIIHNILRITLNL